MVSRVTICVGGRVVSYLLFAGLVACLVYVAYLGGLQRVVFFIMGVTWSLAAFGMAKFSVGYIRETKISWESEIAKIVMFAILLLGLLGLGYSSIKWAITGEGEATYLSNDEASRYRH